MDFRIADTFTDSLARLTGEEQKAVKTTAFDLQLNPAHPSMSLHRIEQSKDKHFWSVRAGSDIRIVLHKTPGSLLLCFVDHHDKAYEWAARRKLETHPSTGAAQWVEVRETALMPGESFRFRPGVLLQRCFNPRPALMPGESATMSRQPLLQRFQSTPGINAGRIAKRC